ncbi:MAG: DNA recombination protein RmuC [Verrucomicrobiota bacterium]|nr:DNA recombination protein RmuC [Verrucomicrobiota bacterium]
MTHPAVLALLMFALGAAIGFAIACRRAQADLRARTRLEEELRQLGPVRDEAARLRDENTSLKTSLAELSKEKEAQAEKLSWIEKAEAQLREAFQALSAQSLQTNAEEYLKLVRRQLEGMQDLMRGDWGKHRAEMSGLVQPLQERLKTLDQQVRDLEMRREGAYKGIEQHIQQLRAAYVELRDTTTGLATALTKSATARGTWGEIELRRIVELAGMVNHVDFEQQETSEQGRPDMLIRLPNRGIMPVDAKTTLESYRQVVEAQTDAERRNLLKDHAQVVRNTVRDLSRREYWKQFERAPEFVVMFLPHDGVLSAAFEGDRELLDFAFSQRVLLATPITLLALLKTVAYGWQQQATTENAQQIAQEGRVLYERLTKFVEHLTGVGDALNHAVSAYNETVGSMERRLMPAARRFQDSGVSATPLSAPRPVDQPARLPQKEQTRTEAGGRLSVVANRQSDILRNCSP